MVKHRFVINRVIELVGSLPGIYIGSHLTGRIPEHLLRPCLAIMLSLIGYKLAF